MLFLVTFDARIVMEAFPDDPGKDVLIMTGMEDVLVPGDVDGLRRRQRHVRYGA